MSGIFKSVKKTLKKVGKVIKKIAPVLIVAAAVYFGGAYLMSMGAGPAAAGSAAQSVTKSAGVWKSFLGGLSNGTAAQSAASYAEASYITMVKHSGSLSAQVAAGTSAVEALGATGSVAQSVPIGVSAGNTYTQVLQSGATPEIAQQAATQSVAESLGVTTLEKLPGAEAAAEAAITTLPRFPGDQALAEGAITDLGTVTPEMQASALASDSTLGPVTEEMRQKLGNATQYRSASTSHPVTEATKASNVSRPASATVPGVESLDASDPDYWKKRSILLDERRDVAEQMRHEQVMAVHQAQANKSMWGLGIQGLGMLSSVYGQYAQGRAVEKERERVLNWKPTGTEVDSADPTKPFYPDGIIS